MMAPALLSLAGPLDQVVIKQFGGRITTFGHRGKTEGLTHNPAGPLFDLIVNPANILAQATEDQKLMPLEKSIPPTAAVQPGNSTARWPMNETPHTRQVMMKRPATRENPTPQNPNSGYR